jgi:hypothetical protein
MATTKSQSGDKKNGADGQGHSRASQGQSLADPIRTESVSELGVLEQVQESGKEIASRSLEAVSERTRAATSGYQSDITAGLQTLADGLRKTSTTLQDAPDDKPLSTAGARYMEELAQRIDSVSAYVERKDPADVIKDVKRFARQNPTIFVGGSFALGFALSRLLRSAAVDGTSNSRVRSS